MALLQVAQFAVEALVTGGAIAAAASLVVSWKSALPHIVELRAAMALPVEHQELRTTIRTVQVRAMLVRAVAQPRRAALKAPAWGELRAAA